MECRTRAMRVTARRPGRKAVLFTERVRQGKVITGVDESQGNVGDGRREGQKRGRGMKMSAFLRK